MPDDSRGMITVCRRCGRQYLHVGRRRYDVGPLRWEERDLEATGLAVESEETCDVTCVAGHLFDEIVEALHFPRFVGWLDQKVRGTIGRSEDIINNRVHRKRRS